MLLNDISRVSRQAGVVVITTSEADGILAATNYLSSRSAPGAVVSVDLESFKSDQINDKEHKQLIDKNIPIYSVSKGGDLSKSLRFENSRSFMDERFIN